MKKFWRNLFDVLDDVLAYILTVVGILAATYIPQLKTGEVINVELGVWRIILSAIVALLVVGKSEQLDGKDEDDKANARAGRKKRFWQRMSNALAQGVMWSTVINVAAS